MNTKEKEIKFEIHILNYQYYPEALLTFFKESPYPRNKYTVHLWDDGSPTFILEKLKTKVLTIPNAVLHSQKNNIGRAKMRNKIHHSFHGEWGVFLDSDMSLSPQFFNTIEHTLVDPKKLYIGQFTYPEKPPSKSQVLHWKYGRLRETKYKNQDQPEFQTGIYLLHHSLNSLFVFPEQLNKYGHEDTWMGHILKEQQIPVQRIHQLAVHLGLHSQDVFLKHQKEAIQNLKKLIIEQPQFKTRLTQTGHYIKHISPLVHWITAKRTETFCIRKLSHSNPNLLYLDILKLHYYLREENKKA